MSVAARRFLRGFGWFLAIVAVFVTMALEFAYPDYSETQLFLAFWPAYLGCVVLLIVGYTLTTIEIEPSCRDPRARVVSAKRAWDGAPGINKQRRLATRRLYSNGDKARSCHARGPMNKAGD